MGVPGTLSGSARNEKKKNNKNKNKNKNKEKSDTSDTIKHPVHEVGTICNFVFVLHIAHSKIVRYIYFFINFVLLLLL